MADQPFHEVLGIGSPFVDHIVEVSEDFVNSLSGTKGGMYPVGYVDLLKIIEESGREPHLVFGGSSANTIKGLTHLGHSCALFGRIGRDRSGEKFLRQLQTMNIRSFLKDSETPTAQAVCLITPDGERTMRSYLGASLEMCAEDLRPELFEGVKLVHIEGYRLSNGSLVLSAMQQAKKAGAKISFDLGSFETVNAYRDIIYVLLNRYVDILFGNRQEILALTSQPPEKGCGTLQNLCEAVVVLMDREGCLIGSGSNQIYHQPAYLVENPADTTGAGDLFASGFLHGYLQGKTLEECARYGALTSSAVVKIQGSDIPLHVWKELKPLLE